MVIVRWVQFKATSLKCVYENDWSLICLTLNPFCSLFFNPDLIGLRVPTQTRSSTLLTISIFHSSFLQESLFPCSCLSKYSLINPLPPTQLRHTCAHTHSHYVKRCGPLDGRQCNQLIKSCFNHQHQSAPAWRAPETSVCDVLRSVWPSQWTMSCDLDTCVSPHLSSAALCYNCGVHEKLNKVLLPYN